MALHRELTVEEKRFCEALGEVVIFWNHIESGMRTLLRRAATIGDASRQRIMVLVAHLGNVGLADAITAIADDLNPDIRAHLQHCAALFDAERVYRNYYVHYPLTFWSTDTETTAFAMSVSAKGGTLKRHSARIKVGELEEFNERLSQLQNYLGDLLLHSMGKLERPLSSLEMPPLPDRLELPRQRLIELQHPPQP